MTANADDRRVAFHGGTIGEYNGGGRHEMGLADVFVGIEAELAGFLGNFLADVEGFHDIGEAPQRRGPIQLGLGRP